ncbi:MAG: ECF transporter S component [Lachnospiraceae bacterium]|nr:ECF transporter S component [Lachnospiraceae bacterium]MDD3794697.1 ECF transporter S component [Lachnospiraceae bacterium]
MKQKNQTVVKLAQTALLAALCFVSFTFLQIKIPMPGGDATSLHIGNAFCVLAALLLGGGYGGLAGAVGMTIADMLDPVYITGAPKTFVLKLCIGLITGLVAHRIAHISESTDKKYVFKWSVIASVCGLGFNVIADPIVGYFYKMYILGQPQEMASVLAKWSTATTFVNAVVSTVLVAAIYNVLRPALLKAGLLNAVTEGHGMRNPVGAAKM